MGSSRALSIRPCSHAMQLSIADIADAFPDYRVAVVVAEGLTIAPERPAALDALIASARRRRARDGAARSCRKFPASRRGAPPTRASASSRRAIAPRSSGWSRTCWPAGRSRASTPSSISTTRCRSRMCCRSAPTISTRSRRRSPSAMRARATASSTWRTARRRGGRAGSAEAGRGGLCRRRPRAVPALELAAGCPLADHAATAPARS